MENPSKLFSKHAQLPLEPCCWEKNCKCIDNMDTTDIKRLATMEKPMKLLPCPFCGGEAIS